MSFAQPADRQNMLATIAGRWRAWRSLHEVAALERLGENEVGRIARDLSLTTGELRALAGKSADAALLLYRRMIDFRLDRAEVARSQPGVMRDLQKHCALCASQARCTRDLACHAKLSAWRSYCPNDDTLRALAPTVAASDGDASAVESPTITRQSDRRKHALSWSLLLIVGIWLTLMANPRQLNLRLDSAQLSIGTSSDTKMAIACLDESCLSERQRSALELLHTVRTQGWINSSAVQVATLPGALSDAQHVQEGQELICRKLGGTPYFSLMFQSGCSRGAIEAARRDGVGQCRPMSAGGVCFLE